MGQKVNPHGLRVGVIKDWDSRWYARADQVGDLVVEDYNIRKYLKNKLYSAGIAKIEVERNNAKVKINIHCSRPGVVIGKAGAEIENLRKDMEARLGKSVNLNIVEVRSPDLNAQLVAENIAQQLEKRISFRRAMKKAMAGGVSLSCMYITWETYQCGNVLSLIVSCGWGFDMNTHSVYLYDTATGEQMTTAQLLETLQVEPETFLAAVRQAAAERFDGKYAGIGGDTDELVAERRAWTLSDENINLDVMTYADAAGNLYVYLPIGSIAGAASYEEPLTLDLGAAG